MVKGILKSAFYNPTTAGQRIDQLTASRASLTGTVTHAQPVGDVDSTRVTIFEERDPRIYKLVHVNTTEECMFRLVGALSLVDFPLTRAPPANDRLRHRTQTLGLMGFGSQTFDDAIERLQHFLVRMERALPNGTVEKDPSFLINNDTSKELILKCRYFTTGADARNTPNVDLPPLADYNDIIARMLLRDDVRYGENNRVIYQRAIAQEHSHKLTYEPVSPIEFRPGDIVEVGFTMIGIPVSGEVKILLVQNAVTLLDDELGNAALIAERERYRSVTLTGVVAQPPLPQKTVKRKTGFFTSDAIDTEDREVKLARQGVQQMTIDSQIPVVRSS